METVHFRIDEETKRLAMQAAKRYQTDLTKLMRQKAEELADEEREYQKNSHAYWLEKEIEEAVKRCEAGKSTFIGHEESQNRMVILRSQLCGDEK
ncbi:TPA: damage-inducible protein J [Salmonella enterica]|uniref:Damage-inducible protein J n=1 Tax=Salmonella enterica TaxID=28901 RepID=A0A759YIT8_SALER|nr:damage-inducible protein J [Salmonella enterica subsp. enterica serovar Bareilly]HAG2284214.1 damage-inducible protein J [Salmonella enterica]HCL5312673.1 damage-inducible protein J [Salmonella enterica]